MINIICLSRSACPLSSSWQRNGRNCRRSCRSRPATRTPSPPRAAAAPTHIETSNYCSKPLNIIETTSWPCRSPEHAWIAWGPAMSPRTPTVLVYTPHASWVPQRGPHRMPAELQYCAVCVFLLPNMGPSRLRATRGSPAHAERVWGVRAVRAQLRALRLPAAGSRADQLPNTLRNRIERQHERRWAVLHPLRARRRMPVLAVTPCKQSTGPRAT